MDKNYVKDLENFVKKMITPLKDLSFGMIIKIISDCRVLPFSKYPKLINLLKKVFKQTTLEINRKGIKSTRPNEVGNKIEPFVKKSLNQFNLQADTPANKNGKRISTGYPDIIFQHKKSFYYLECKTYNLKNKETTQRSFYFSPSNNFKITKDAPHLMVSFEVEKRGKYYFVNYWKLFSLEKMRVDLKHEFNQSNKKMYADDSCLDLIVEGRA